MLSIVRLNNNYLSSLRAQPGDIESQVQVIYPSSAVDAASSRDLALHHQQLQTGIETRHHLQIDQLESIATQIELHNPAPDVGAEHWHTIEVSIGAVGHAFVACARARVTSDGKNATQAKHRDEK